MSDQNSELLVEHLIPNTNTIDPVQELIQPEEGLVQSILKKISNNKMYIYIGIAIIVLGVVLYYFFIKNKKETMCDTDKNNNLTLQPQSQYHQSIQSNQVENNTFNPNPLDQEYYVLDTNGNPVKVYGSLPTMNQQLETIPIPNQHPSQQDIQMLQKQMIEQPLRRHPDQVKTIIKLEHPNDTSVNENTNNDLNNELTRIQDNENENIAEHNLTKSELAEINKKLENNEY